VKAVIKIFNFKIDICW